MPCNEWNENWVAHLYDEMAEAEEQQLRRHLASCESCTSHMAELAASREALRDACPVVPAAPNVLVLRPRRWFQPLWAYAAGAAFAMLVFAGGLAAGYHLLGEGPAATTAAVGSDPALPSESERALLARLDSMQQRIEELERTDTARPAEEPLQASYLTRGEFEEQVRQWERRNDVQRARDFQFLLDEITASELRTGEDIDETRNALQVVAVRNDPRFMER